MANIDVYDGTYLNQPIAYNENTQLLTFPSEKIFSRGESIHAREIEMIELATEENVRLINPTWDLKKAKLAETRPSTSAGLFGIAAIGYELFTKGIRVTFIVKFKNRKPVLATTNEGIFNQLRAHLKT